MKKKLLGIIIIVMVFTACNARKDQILEGFSSCEEFYSDGYQDYTDYCKYYYSEKDDIKFSESDYYSIVTKEDIDDIKKYFEEFPYGTMKESSKYDFESIKITEGDYYYMEENSDDGYSVFLYDLDEHTLYYIHHNI